MLALQAARLHKCYGETDFLRPRILPPNAFTQSHHVTRHQQVQEFAEAIDEELEDLSCRLALTLGR
jgi:hypothetical protein